MPSMEPTDRLRRSAAGHGWAREVKSLNESINRSAGDAIPLFRDRSAGGAPLAARIRGLQKLRQSRARIFGESLFADPAWDILLELYAACLEGGGQPVSNVCIASGVPSTTAIRWIRALETGGWIRRSADSEDGRRCILSLSENGEEAMRRFFEQAGFLSGG